MVVKMEQPNWSIKARWGCIKSRQWFSRVHFEPAKHTDDCSLHRMICIHHKCVWLAFKTASLQKWNKERNYLTHWDSESYFGGGHSRFWDQVLVDTGACNGSFVAVGWQGTGSGKPSRKGCAGVLLGNLLDNQHFGNHLFATRGVFWNINMRGWETDLKLFRVSHLSRYLNLNWHWVLLPHTPAWGATARIWVPGFPVVSGLREG